VSDGADAGCELTELLGLDMDRSTLAGWVGKSAALLEPLGVSETLCMRVGPCEFHGSFVEPFWI